MTGRGGGPSGSRKEWIAFAVIALVTLAGALGILRWLAPQLLGLPVDLRLVGVSETQPAFYDGVFRGEDYQGNAMLVNDPVTVVRGRPGAPETPVWGPHDILGFRNRAVPDTADVVVIGDSQTYGNNAVLEDNWPSRMAAVLPGPGAGVYAMAMGGWGAAQYLEMAAKSVAFRPQVVVVAFYTGNDPLDSFKLAYSLDRFADLRPDPGLDAGDLPQLAFPPPPEQRWEAVFGDGTKTVFTARLRLASNAPGPVADAGYGVMVAAAREIVRLLAPSGARVLFTAIPTKERVYADRVAREGLDAPEDFIRLADAEARRIDALAAALAGIPDAHYVDVAGPLRKAALAGAPLYPSDPNGHPLPTGYALIGGIVARAAAALMPPRPQGLLAVHVGGDQFLLYLALPEGLWRFTDAHTAEASGWRLDQALPVSFDVVAGLPRLGRVAAPDPQRFGPGAVR